MTLPEIPASDADADHDPLLTAFVLSLPSVTARHYWQQMRALGPVNHWRQWPLRRCLAGMPAAAHGAMADYYRRGDQSEALTTFTETLARLRDQGVQLLDHAHPGYPELLRQIPEPPALLYLRGSPAALSAPQVAFVGSRSATRYGLQAAHDFARYLGSCGLAITSGLAAGVDAQAHRGTLAGGGVTLAVLGTGIDRMYPSRHKSLAEAMIASGGALVSEFAPGTPPYSGNFPRRNRIISGLSLGVLVVEAALKSGSLITAGCALEQGRDVFAIPGSIHSPQSRGCHRLLREGATLVESAEDIAAELAHWLPAAAPADVAAPPQAPALASADARRLWDCLDYQPAPVDLLVARSGLATGTVLALLGELELQGSVEHSPEGYQRRPGL